MLDADNPAENTEGTPAGSPADPPPVAPPADAGADPGADTPAAKKTAKKAATKKAATAKKAPAKRATKKTAAPETTDAGASSEAAQAAEQAPARETAVAEPGEQTDAPAAKKTAKKAATKKAATAKKTPAKRATKKAAAPETDAGTSPEAAQAAEPAPAGAEDQQSTTPAGGLLFQAPEPTKTPQRRKRAEPKADEPADAASTDQQPTAAPQPDEAGAQGQGSGAQDSDDDEGEGGGGRRRRRRGGRRRRKSDGDQESGDQGSNGDQDNNGDKGNQSSQGNKGNKGSGGGDDSGSDSDSDGEGGSGSRRRRRRRRSDSGSGSGSGSDGGSGGGGDDPDNTVTRVRKARSPEDEITSLTGSTRLEAKKQRRKEGREAGRRRAPIVSEAEFLARREAVDRVMVIRQHKDLTQIAVMEDKVLVEHYVARESQTSLIGNVYLGRVQNVLPSMEAAFIDIGKGRNAVLYAGEVNWDALGAKSGQGRKIESVLKSGQPVLVQVTKDPIGHKGARLTSQISLPGRFLVYVPDGTTSGISRKLPDTERSRLKTLLKEMVPGSAGVIVRTAAEGASEEELTRDVERLTARWDDISGKIDKGNAPQLLYGEPDLTLKVVRDLFTEDFAKLVVSGADAWDVVDGYVEHVAPDLADRLEKYEKDEDVFAAYRIDEQIAKGLDRKVWLPSGGSLVIDRTEAMTVVDVNTGKFTGSGGNLEETVTKNNLEAAEEIVRQLRLRDIGGIIVVDFIDMVLESNRDLVLRRMVECLGRDRTRHQVAEVTSLGLVQMTRKRIGTGLLEAFSEGCEHCQGRGLVVHHEPVEPKKKSDDEPRRNRRSGRSRGRGGDDTDDNGSSGSSRPSPKDVAAVAKPENADRPPVDGEPVEQPETNQPEVKPEAKRSETKRAEAKQPEVKQSEAEQPESEPSEPVAKPVRRRASRARRPAGPPTTSTDGTTPAEPAVRTPVPAPEAAPDTTPEPVAEPVVTTTSVRRRGSARREAGPPAGGS